LAGEAFLIHENLQSSN